jgi:hypothetical protein
MKKSVPLSRRKFLGASALATGGILLGCSTTQKISHDEKTESDLPVGSAPEPLPCPHFPSRLHAFVWRNWQLIPAKRMAEVVGAKTSEILQLGAQMGLQKPPRITVDQQRRSYITVIRTIAATARLVVRTNGIHAASGRWLVLETRFA